MWFVVWWGVGNGVGAGDGDYVVAVGQVRLNQGGRARSCCAYRPIGRVQLLHHLMGPPLNNTGAVEGTLL